VANNINGVRFLRGSRILPVGEYREGQIPILDLERGLESVESLHFKGGTAVDAIELAEGWDDRSCGAAAPAASALSSAPAVDGGPSRIIAANANRAFIYDRRAGPRPIARLAQPGISALASLPADAAIAVPSLLAATRRDVHVYDVRRLPEDTPAVKKPPAALATLKGSAEGGVNAPWTSLAAMGSIIVAGDREGGVSVWDVARPRPHDADALADERRADRGAQAQQL
jgi:hypothetical protein